MCKLHEKKKNEHGWHLLVSEEPHEEHGFPTIYIWFDHSLLVHTPHQRMIWSFEKLHRILLYLVMACCWVLSF